MDQPNPVKTTDITAGDKPAEDKQPRGDFVAFMNRDKEPGDRKPTFDGRLNLPDSETEIRFALWSHEYVDKSTGEVLVMFNGQGAAVAASDTPMQQVSTLMKTAGAHGREATVGNLSLNPRQVVLFPNKFRDEAPDKERPDFWGAYNPGNGAPVVRISAWMRKARHSQMAYLSGATSYPIPGKTEAEMQAAQDNLADMIDRGEVSVGMPAKARGKRSKGESGRDERG